MASVKTSGLSGTPGRDFLAGLLSPGTDRQRDERGQEGNLCQICHLQQLDIGSHKKRSHDCESCTQAAFACAAPQLHPTQQQEFSAYVIIAKIGVASSRPSGSLRFLDKGIEMHKFFFLATAFLAFLLLAPAAWAQDATGKIAGNITDATGAVVPGATVVVTNLDTTDHQASRHEQPGFLPGAAASHRTLRS